MLALIYSQMKKLKKKAQPASKMLSVKNDNAFSIISYLCGLYLNFHKNIIVILLIT
jgi:hypothetical protein